MTVIRNFSITILFITGCLLSACNSGTVDSSLPNTTTSLEQKALDIFKDSIVNKNPFDPKKLGDDEIFRVPYGMDKNWLSDGLFHNYKLFVSARAFSLADPGVDRAFLFVEQETMPDSLYNTLSSYLDYVEKFKKDTTTVPVAMPGTTVISVRDFDPESLNPGSAYIEVRKKLVSEKLQFVELRIAKRGFEPDTSLNYFRVLCDFDLNDNLIDWKFTN